MSKKTKIIILIICTLFFSNIIANADAGFSGTGSSGSGGGGANGKCTGGYCLALAPILKFSLVDVSGNKINSLVENYMINNSGTYKAIFNSNKNKDFGNSCANCIRGKIENDKYSDGAYLIEKIPDNISFSQSTLKKIIPNTIKIWPNFQVENLKNAIISSCDSNGCSITSEYEKVVIYMLEKANIIPYGNTSIDNLTENYKNELSKYRIIIEPVFALKKNDANYMFATSKAIANMTINTGKQYGIGAYELLNNLYADETVNTAINYPTFIGYDSANPWESLTNVKNGGGYAIVKLSYNISNKCYIKQSNNEYIFVDNTPAEFANDTNGNNLEYYIDQCSCNNSDLEKYKNEILYNPVLKQIYDTKCPQQKKICQYDNNGSTYTFYDNNGNNISSYEEFISSCGCTNDKVLELKNNSFNTLYNLNCPNPNTKSKKTYSSTLNKCDVNENVSGKYGGNGQNVLSKMEKKSLSDNEFCSVNCEEEIVTNGFVDKYSVLAGKKFELSTLPKLTANKVCKVKVDYSSWKESYDILIDDEAAALTKLDFDNAVRNARSTRELCSCDSTGACTSATRYDYSYNEYYYNGNSISSTSISDFYGGCNSKQQPTISSNLSNMNALSLKKSNLEKHFEKLKTCSSYLSNQGTTNQEYYKFKVGLSYYYQQEYIKSGLVWNNRKPNGETDDSPMNSKLESETSDGNYTKYKNNNTCYTYIKDNSNINATYCAGTTPALYSVDIYRSTEYKYSFAPSVIKYTDILSGKISSIVNNLNNPILIGNVYDTDITAKAKKNNSNYYEFTSIGENNDIYKYFEETNQEKLKRYCDYEITSEVTKDDKFNLVYRIVDPNNIDPNNRKKENIGLKNWTQEQIDIVNNEDTFNPDNLEYSFTLDSKTIKEIREYNKNRSYSDISFTCTNGLECKSKFIESASKGSSDFSTKFATNITGSTKWKKI